MPIHEWTRVSAGTWHDFHLSWVAELKAVLNTGILPEDYYSTAYYDTSLRTAETIEAEGFESMDESEFYVHKRRTVSICCESDDRVVALLEKLSPGNKSSRRFFSTFVDKAVRALGRGQNLLVVDLFPPGPNDLQGIHGAIWEEMDSNTFRQPLDLPLTTVSYDAGPPNTQAYLETTVVGQQLGPMPLFLMSGHVTVPLEESYMAAFKGMPRKYRAILEA